MNGKREYMNVLLKYLMHDKDSEEFDTFLVLLENIKYEPQLMKYYGEEFIQNLKEILPDVTDKYNKASIIETIVQSFYWCVCERGYYEELLDNYIWCLREHATGLNDSIRCLNGFLHVGITERELVKRLFQDLDKERCLFIFSRLRLEVSHHSDKETIDLLKAAERHASISERSAIIAQFLLLVHPHIRKYAGISQIRFLYDSYKGIYEDCWPKGLLPNHKETLMKKKILSPKEVDILERLNELINMQEEDLDSNKVRELYDEFFEEQDPFEVIFTLPL